MHGFFRKITLVLIFSRTSTTEVDSKQSKSLMHKSRNLVDISETESLPNERNNNLSKSPMEGTEAPPANDAALKSIEIMYPYVDHNSCTANDNEDRLAIAHDSMEISLMPSAQQAASSSVGKARPPMLTRQRNKVSECDSVPPASPSTSATSRRSSSSSTSTWSASSPKTTSKRIKERGGLTLPLQRASTISNDELQQPLLGRGFPLHLMRSPMRTNNPPLHPPSNSSTAETLIDIPIIRAMSVETDNASSSAIATTNNSAIFVDEKKFQPLITIPTFTVTINPLEANEMTYVPESPQEEKRHNSLGAEMATSIANTTIVVDDDAMLGADEDEDHRRCSIGSASSFQSDPQESNMQTLGLADLGIRRVSDISHINEIRREVSGMDHLASEFYEISREPNPDAISLDSIHKRVLKRCQNKYIPPQRSSMANKCFVVITTGFTFLGIVYGFWYKNFGPGHDDH